MDMATGGNRRITLNIDANVQLQNLDAERRKLENAFGNVDVGSRHYRELQRTLNTINSAYEETARLASSAFRSNADVDKYTRSITRLRSSFQSFDDVYANLGRNDFTNNIFPEGFLDRVEQARRDLEQAQRDYASLGDRLFSQAVSGKGNLSSILKGQGVLDTASYDEMERAISRALGNAIRQEESYARSVAESQSAIDGMREALARLNEEKANQDSANSQTQNQIDTKQNEITAKRNEAAARHAERVNQINEKYTKQLEPLQTLTTALNAKQDQRQNIMSSVFKNGGGFKDNKDSIADFLVKQALAAGMQNVTKEDVMKMTQEKIKELINSIQETINASRNKELKRSESSSKSVTTKLDNQLKGKEQEVEQLRRDLESGQQLSAQMQRDIDNQNRAIERRQRTADLQEANRLNAVKHTDNVRAAQQELQDAQRDSQNALGNSAENANLERLRQELDGLTEAERQYVLGAAAAGRATDGLGGNFDSMGAQASEAKKQIDQLDQMQTKLTNGVTNVVNRYLGFYAILNKVRAAVRTMINDIRELDKAITEIAIVTNFSQDDLWKQMPTYSAMAKEYGTSIKGVYEITQLYYQQGRFNYSIFYFLT
nr:MAG TPA: minor tail protein [Caudoviricetes sp.]